MSEDDRPQGPPGETPPTDSPPDAPPQEERSRTAEIIDFAAERERRRGDQREPSEFEQRLSRSLKDGFTRYFKERLPQPDAEEPAKVKIDKSFLAEHGAGMLATFFGALSESLMPPAAPEEEGVDGPEDPAMGEPPDAPTAAEAVDDAPTPAPEAESAAPNEPSTPEGASAEVRLDLTEVFKQLFTLTPESLRDSEDSLSEPQDEAPTAPSVEPADAQTPPQEPPPEREPPQPPPEEGPPSD